MTMPETHHAIPPPPSHAPTEAPAEMHEATDLGLAVDRIARAVPTWVWCRSTVVIVARDRDECVSLTVDAAAGSCPTCTPRQDHDR